MEWHRPRLLGALNDSAFVGFNGRSGIRLVTLHAWLTSMMGARMGMNETRFIHPQPGQWKLCRRRVNFYTNQLERDTHLLDVLSRLRQKYQPNTLKNVIVGHRPKNEPKYHRKYQFRIKCRGNFCSHWEHLEWTSNATELE